MLIAQATEKTSLLLPLLMLVPLLGGLVLAAWPRLDEVKIRYSALGIALLAFFISLIVLGQFEFGMSAKFQLAHSFDWVSSFGLHFQFGADSISLWLVLLTTLLQPLVVLGSFSAVEQRTKEFFVWLLILEAAMIGVFVAQDIIFFYVCFEFTLVPLYFLIGIFGSTQRLKAARMFFFYTFTGSMLTFAGLLYVAWFASTTNQFGWTFDIETLIKAAQEMPATKQGWVLMALLAGFAVKVPLFPVHTWLPLVHTEAPTAGSVMLAGVLLKLGTYALLRFAIPMTPDAILTFAPYIGVFAVIGILYTALICWVQKDIKKLIAYSSVSHLGFCVLGMFSLNAIGMGGSVMYMINHGLSTGALFLCVGMIYERFHTRQMREMGGLVKVMPVWSFFMVFFCLASVGLPGLNGFVGEFLTLLGAFAADGILGPKYAIAAGFGMIFAAIYILFMVGKVVFGPVKVPEVEGHEPPMGGTNAAEQVDANHGHGYRVLDLNLREIITLTPLALGCLWLGLWPTTVLRTLEDPIRNLIGPDVQAKGIAPAPPVPSPQGVEPFFDRSVSENIVLRLDMRGPLLVQPR